MPRYHFHLHKRIEAHDEEGMEFPDLAAAKASAIMNARHLMAAEIKDDGRIRLSDSIEICDPDGVRLHVTRYGDCVDIQP